MRVKYKLSYVVASILAATAVFADTHEASSRDKHMPIFEHFVMNVPEKSHKIVNFQALQPRVIDVQKTQNGVQYIFSNGEIIERTGGSIAWRNNNPGCIRYNSKKHLGAIGSANRFAIFPDEATGMRAIKSLLLSDSYRNLSIASAIHMYAPPHENDTQHYIRALCGLVGVSANTKLCNLNDDQLDCVVSSIRKIEGWIVGTEKFIPSQQPDESFTNVSFIRSRINECTMCWVFDRSI